MENFWLLYAIAKIAFITARLIKLHLIVDIVGINRVFKPGQRQRQENITPKYNLALSQVLSNYSVLLTLYNTGEVFCN